nr:hypothetical protein [Tolivirales sp.]
MSGNYTGPYWSDGSIQTSVEFGESQPTDYVDEMSRLHDSAYAKFKGDDNMLRAADEIYYESLLKDPSAKAKLAREAVLYGNYTVSKLARLAEIEKTAASLGPLGLLGGLLYFGVENIFDMNSRLTGDKYSKEKTILRDYYETDPRKTGPQPGASVPAVPETAVSTHTELLTPQLFEENHTFSLVTRKRRRRRRRKIKT